MITFFLACFAFGVIFTIASFALGAFGGSDLDIPGLDFLGGEHAAGGTDGAADHAGHLSPFNLSTISAFLAWFGGAGYLLARYSDLAAVSVLLVAAAAGVVGGGIIFLAITRYVLPRLTELRAEDFQIQGAVARVTAPICVDGVGEIVYTLGNSQQIDGARSTTNEAIERGAEVVILRREKGIAYVERWDKFASSNQLPPGDTT